MKILLLLFAIFTFGNTADAMTADDVIEMAKPQLILQGSLYGLGAGVTTAIATRSVGWTLGIGALVGVAGYFWHEKKVRREFEQFALEQEDWRYHVVCNSCDTETYWLHSRFDE